MDRQESSTLQVGRGNSSVAWHCPAARRAQRPMSWGVPVFFGAIGGGYAVMNMSTLTGPTRVAAIVFAVAVAVYLMAGVAASVTARRMGSRRAPSSRFGGRIAQLSVSRTADNILNAFMMGALITFMGRADSVADSVAATVAVNTAVFALAVFFVRAGWDVLFGDRDRQQNERVSDRVTRP